MNIQKPYRLKEGDKVATVSLSWGGAGDPDILWRYYVGKERLEKEFGLQVVEMPHTLSGSEFIYKHPEKRAQDLMQAFADPSIKGIFSCIGGDESIRILPYIDFELIRKNPKVFIGYSDTTIAHLICLKAGVSNFYGPSILAEFSENVKIFDYTKEWVKKALFEEAPLGEVTSSSIWTSKYVAWEEKNKLTERQVARHEGYEILQGKGKAWGKLIGGCIEVLEMAKGTLIWHR